MAYRVNPPLDRSCRHEGPTWKNPWNHILASGPFRNSNEKERLPDLFVSVPPEIFVPIMIAFGMAEFGTKQPQVYDIVSESQAYQELLHVLS